MIVKSVRYHPFNILRMSFRHSSSAPLLMYLVTNGCLSISRISILSSGFFLIELNMKFFASSVTSTYSGKVISSVTWIGFNCYDSVEVELWIDFERYLSDEAFVGHHSYGPDVYLFVVGSLGDQFRTVVKRSARNSSPHFVARVNCPPEVADFDCALNRKVSTNWKRMFSGLMSRCMICSLWM